MRKARTAFLFMLLLPPAPPALASQEMVTPGERLRLTSQRFDLHAKDGRLLSVKDDSILVEVRRMRTIRYREVLAPDTISIPLAALDRVEVSRASGRRTLRGALIGGGIAAALGYVMGSGYMTSCDDCVSKHSPEVQGLIGAGLFGAAGAVVGALVGSGIRWDRWQEVSIGVQLRF